MKPALPSPDRRSFLLGAAALVVTACTDGSDDATPPSSAATSPTTATAETATTASAEASGDGADPTSPDAESDITPLTPAMFDAIASCALTATSTSGPFPTIDRMDRRVIHEDRPGHPLRLGLRVVDAACAPIPGAVVDVWHTDATGDYSEFEDGGSGKDEGAGSTFCRGFQVCDGDGIAEFETIYPGWYEGRAVHIHVSVAVDDESIFVGQLYLDEAYTEQVFATGEYAQFGSPDTPWSDDRIIGDPAADGTELVLAAAPTGIGPGTLGLVNLGVPS